jgi:hypothetical protein
MIRPSLGFEKVHRVSSGRIKPKNLSSSGDGHLTRTQDVIMRVRLFRLRLVQDKIEHFKLTIDGRIDKRQTDRQTDDLDYFIATGSIIQDDQY